MITITARAAQHLIQQPGLHLRVSVRGGGCQGLEYEFSLDSDIADDDLLLEQHGVKILVDAMSSVYLEGSVLDYTSDVSGSGFVIVNPQATGTCGCGSSFSI
jgi:iron-sulfur cluster insertion protein